MGKWIDAFLRKITPHVNTLLTYSWTNRSTTGKKYLYRYQKSVTTDPQSIEKFHTFDILPMPPFATPPLTRLQAASIEFRQKHGDRSEAYERLLSLQNNPGTTRKSFNLNDWKTLDLLNLQLVQDQLQLMYELFQSGYELVGEAIDGIDFREVAVAEVLAKSLVISEGLEGQLLTVPMLLDNQEMESVDYRIKKTTLGNQLPCYVLTPRETTAPPWLLIRGTEFTPGGEIDETGAFKEYRQGGEEGVFADFGERNGLGEHALAKAADPATNYQGTEKGYGNLHQLLHQTFAGKKLMIAGHSLGGCLANTLAVLFPDSIQKVYAFGAPGVSKHTAEQCRTDLSDRIYNFTAQGDIVPAVGARLIGRHYQISGNKNFLDSHLTINFLQKEIEIQRVDTTRENALGSRQRHEMIRRWIGYALFQTS